MLLHALCSAVLRRSTISGILVPLCGCIRQHMHTTSVFVYSWGIPHPQSCFSCHQITLYLEGSLIIMCGRKIGLPGKVLCCQMVVLGSQIAISQQLSLFPRLSICYFRTKFFLLLPTLLTLPTLLGRSKNKTVYWQGV